MIEDTNSEVAGQVGRKVTPIVVFQSLGCVVDVIDGINPHESGVIGQIDGDLGIPFAEQGRPIRGIESRCD